MECGKLTAKLRDAVPVCFIENGKEVKRFKNIEIPDEIKKLPYQDFEFSVPVTGAITFKIMFAVFIYTGGASSGGGRFGRAGLALGGCASGFVAGTAFARSGRGPSHGRPFPAPRPLFFAAPPRSRAPLARLGWKRPRGCSRGAYSPRPQGRPLYTPHGRQPACSLPSAQGSVCRSPAGRHPLLAAAAAGRTLRPIVSYPGA